MKLLNSNHDSIHVISLLVCSSDELCQGERICETPEHLTVPVCVQPFEGTKFSFFSSLCWFCISGSKMKY